MRLKMPRTVKIVKDENNNDLEVYSDNCSVCNKEMIFPKSEADKIDAMFPFIKEKMESGASCFDCAKQKEQEDKEFIFSDEEKKKIIEAIFNNGKQ